MTAAQQLELRREKRGRQEGIQIKSMETAKNMLSEGFAANLIQKLAGIGEGEFRQLEKAYSKDN